MKKTIKTCIMVLLCISIVLTGCSCTGGKGGDSDYDYTGETPETSEDQTEQKRSYSVSASNDYAIEVGMSILEAGGNAVDAAVAMGYVLGVVEPLTSGLGGSGGMLIYDSNTGAAVFYDYRAAAGTYNGGDKVAIPGFVLGMEKINADYGTIPIRDLIEPAIYYAEKGFRINSWISSEYVSNYYLVSQYPEYLADDGSLVGVDDVMYMPALAQTLRDIQEQGSSVFYNGYIASDIAAKSSLSVNDLKSYEVIKRDALVADYYGYKIFSANAPLSGLTLLQMLKLSEKIGMADPSEDVYRYLNQFKDIAALAQSDRAQHVADPEFVEEDCQQYLSDQYISNLARSAGYNVADVNGTVEYLDVQEMAERALDIDGESMETTSYSVADSNGLYVTVTNTLSDLFGSRIYVDGFWLNNTNSNFSSQVNSFAPGKRSRTFTAPTIVVGPDGLTFAIGTPGGNKIPGILFLTIERIIKENCPYQEAVDRLRYLYVNGELYIEFDDTGSSELSQYSYNGYGIYVASGTYWGSISLAGYSPTEGAFATYDFRRGATYAGVHN